MNLKKLVIGGIVGGIVFFLLGWLIYGNLLMDFLAKHHGEPTPIGINRQMPLFPYIILGNILSALAVTYIFLKANINTLAGGLVMGGVIGFFMCSGMDSIMFATTHILSRTGVLADVIAGTVMNAIGGAIIGLVLGKLDKSS